MIQQLDTSVMEGKLMQVWLLAKPAVCMHAVKILVKCKSRQHIAVEEQENKLIPISCLSAPHM